MAPAKKAAAATLYYHGTGKRKRAIATVKLYRTGGKSRFFNINGKPLREVLTVDAWADHALRPLKVTELMDEVSIESRMRGGGLHGQSGALSLGIARALLKMNPDLRKTLRQNSLLTRDPRARESKKYGLKRARKAPQYTKR